MKKIFSLILLLCICLIKINAQTIIKGTIEDENNSPLSYVTVVLCTQDTIRVNYAVTDLNGCFEFKAEKEKKYLLQISSVGYKTHYTAAKSGQAITLVPDILAIKEVVIKGNRPISKITSVGIQTIVSNTVLSNIGTGNDVLKHIPMVSGDKGSFDVFGRGKAIIYQSKKIF